MRYYGFPYLYELAFKMPPLLIWRKRSLKTLKKALEEIKINNPQKILDIGCGAGVLTELLRKTYPNSEILGIDFSEQMIAFDNRKYCKVANFKQADFLHFDGKYDLVVSFYSFCFFPLKEGVRKMESIISSEGTGIIIICGKTPFSLIHRFLLKLTGAKLSLYSPEEFKRCFNKKFQVNSKVISDFEGSYILVVKSNG